MPRSSIVFAPLLLLAACTGSTPPAAPPQAAAEPVAEPAPDSGRPVPDEGAKPDGVAAAPRPMDEVPVQKQHPDGEREYRFSNGCVVLLEAKRAVVKRESGDCKLHHRDIALLYASGD